MVRFGGTLRVLMWKHCMVRLRRFVHSAFEFISPAILFLLMLNLPSMSSRSKENSELIYEPKSSTDMSRVMKIFFKPQTLQSMQLIESAAKYLGIKKTPDLSPDIADEGYWSYDNETDFMSYMDISKSDGAGIIFQNLDGQDWPKKLNYTIRMMENFRTESYRTFSPGPHENLGDVYEKFVSLQWAIDKAYMELLTRKNINQELIIQHFPRPKAVEEKQEVELLRVLITICTLLSPLTFFLFFVSRLVLERASGVKELMKMVGVSPGTLHLSHALNSAVACAVFVLAGLLTLKWPSKPMVPYTNGLFIAFTLLLYFIYTIALAFFCSTLLNTTNRAVTLSFSIFGVTVGLAFFVVEHVTNASRFFLLSGLVPHVPVLWFWAEVGALWKYEGGSSYDNMLVSHSPNTGSVAGAWLCLLLQIGLTSCLAWYMDCVRPGNYGMAKPWNFIFKMRWCGQEKVNPDCEEAVLVNRSGREYFESAPNNVQTGIRIANVSKVFGSWGGPKNKALDNVSLEIYKGEITVLLGHNGAGKTTLMSIITGMYSATEGKVYINGKEITENLVEVRKSIGLCPQHNLTFDDLTVKEHVIFFAMLKGATHAAASANCNELLTQLKLLDKANSMSGQLSGGMKRRLQLACALAGGAEVLILDEPTSGLDLETRRELWNLILALRGSRTVLLTTHFMEEADALGDRVAALHGGVLRCHATPMYLKKAIGTGYRLSLTLDPQYSKEDVVTAVSSVIPGSQLKESSPTGLMFALPAKESPQFPKLFNVLEEKKNSLKIKSMGVGVTTLEEVFLRLCSDDHSKVLDTTENGHSNGAASLAPKYKRLQGAALYTQQVQALLKRQCKYVLSKLNTFLLMEILIPVVIILFVSYSTNSTEDALSNPPREMNLDLYGDFGKSKIFYNIGPFSSDILEPLETGFNKFEFVKADNIVRAILDEGYTGMSLYNSLLIGLELNGTHANALYSTSVRHTMPVAVNLLSNMLAKHYLNVTSGDPRTITTVNHPIEMERKHEMLDGFVQPKSLYVCVTWAVIVSALVTSFMIPMVTIAIVERASGSRHIRIMAGCPAAVYWAATCLFHAGVVLLVVVPTILIAAGLLDFQQTFNNLHFLLSMTVITLLFSVAFLMFMYFLSYFMTEGGASSILSVSTVLLCFVIPQITHFLPGSFSSTLVVLCSVFPSYNYAYGLVKMVDIAQVNAMCQLNRHFCPAGESLGFLSPGCCTSNSTIGPQHYFEFKEKHAGAQLVLLVANFCVYGSLVLLMEYGIMNRLWDKLMNSRYEAPASFYQDPMVTAEKSYVDGKIANAKRNGLVGEDAALVHNLHKNYRPLCRKACNSVKGVSFSVKQGECFGLLGVNGAGKSTIFKMLTGGESITSGDISCNGYDVRAQRSAYLSTLTYCPQFGGLDNFLSGWDSVALMVRLRGVPEEHVDEEVNSWINYVDLTEMKERAVGAYSGGCQRRCATAAALAGLGGAAGGRAALLDEPTAGVDPGARRRVWRALRRSLAAGLSVLITSHSMEETEALCGRIAILSRGQLGALGTAAALRAAHATGYSAQLKLRAPSARRRSAGSHDADELDGSRAVAMSSTHYVTTEEANKLKEHIRTNFNSVLKDEHKTMLHYHIEEAIRYSDLFTRMESIKARFADIIEDYTISETTLEEVFLSFAKEAEAEAVEGPRLV